VIESLSVWDTKLFFFVNSLSASWLNPIMVFFSSQLIWTPLITFILYISLKEFPRKQFYLFLLFLLFAIIASDVTSSYILKNITKRLRPCRVEDIKLVMNSFGQKCGGRFGFVSSHASNSFAILTFSVLALKKLKGIFHLIWIFPFLVSYSRIYLGVHFPGDILGGALVGTAWGIIFAQILKRTQLWGQTA
jgi:undecaprenyl-diphosphatase